MKAPKISWYNFTHPNKKAIQKRNKFLEAPVKECINCSHFYFNNDGSAGCNTLYEYTCLKSGHALFELDRIQHYGELEK